MRADVVLSVEITETSDLPRPETRDQLATATPTGLVVDWSRFFTAVVKYARENLVDIS